MRRNGCPAAPVSGRPTLTPQRDKDTAEQSSTVAPVMAVGFLTADMDRAGSAIQYARRHGAVPCWTQWAPPHVK